MNSYYGTLAGIALLKYLGAYTPRDIAHIKRYEPCYQAVMAIVREPKDRRIIELIWDKNSEYQTERVYRFAYEAITKQHEKETGLINYQ